MEVAHVAQEPVHQAVLLEVLVEGKNPNGVECFQKVDLSLPLGRIDKLVVPVLIVFLDVAILIGDVEIAVAVEAPGRRVFIPDLPQQKQGILGKTWDGQ